MHIASASKLIKKNIGSFFEGIILTFFYANPFD
jgi:hypothetical protein